MKNTKQILSVFLALMMIISIIPMSTITASAATSGKCGKNVYWEFNNDTGTLTISGTGAMYDLNHGGRPWENYDDSITSVVINNGVTTIGNNAFISCESLTSVAIPDSVTTIGYSAFNSCRSLTSIIIPNSVTTIDYMVFYCCDSLTSIIIPDSITSIGYDAFYHTAYYNDTNNWENDVLYINNYLISAKITLFDSYTVKDGTKIIGDLAFSRCNSLTDVIIPDSVTTIGKRAIVTEAGITRITVDGNNKYYSSNEDGVLFNKDKTTLVQYPNGTGTSYTIPDSVTTIGNHAFAFSRNLTDVIIPDSVTTIGEEAFHYCTSLTSVTIGDSVTTIGGWAFSICLSLTSVTISDSVTTIGEYAFYGCESLTSIIIPDCITTIDNFAFYLCDHLTDIYYLGTEEQWDAISIGPFYNSPLFNATIHFLGEETHKCSYVSVVTQPTCTEQGYTTYTCECGDSYVDNYVEPSHTPKTITVPASCTVAGMSYSVCEICGETIGDSKVIPATGHTAGDWETVLEPTYEADGKKVKKCTVCGEVVEEEIIPKLVKVTVTDENTGVSMEYGEDDYNGEVEIVVEESFDGTAFDVIDTSLNASQKFIYDITMTVDGVETQPNGAVTIRIPLPAGYDPNRSFVYHVNTETNTVEKMPATYENGYLVFETTHFSYYAVVEEGNYTFNIQSPSRTEIRNKDGIILHAKVDGTAPSGSYVRWESSNGNFDEDANGYDLEIIAKNKGWTTFTAILCAEDGTELARSSVEMYSKSGFFDKIGGFFRSLFGTTKIYEN